MVLELKDGGDFTTSFQQSYLVLFLFGQMVKHIMHLDSNLWLLERTLVSFFLNKSFIAIIAVFSEKTNLKST